MKFYRIKHIPTGLYYIPQRKVRNPLVGTLNSNFYLKSNLSKKGKIYPIRPSLKFIGNDFYSHLPNHGAFNQYNEQLVPFCKEEWKIEEVSVKE